MASVEAHPTAMTASQDDASKGAGGAGEMMQFPSKGSEDEVGIWFSTFEGGKYRKKWDNTDEIDRPTPARMRDMEKDDLNDWLGKPTGAIIYNAIHKHDPAATTGPAATAGFVSPNSHASALGAIREEMKAEMKAAVQEVTQQFDAKFMVLELRNRYSTRDEADVGKAILNDTEQGLITRLELAQEPAIPLNLPSTLLAATATHENDKINKPIVAVLQNVFSMLPLPMQPHDCTKKTPLVDARGRHHKGDGILVPKNAPLAWPHVLTFLEGKHTLCGSDLKIVIGQAQRRAEAVLEQQSWRKYVDIVFHCLSQVGFLRLCNDSPRPTITILDEFVKPGQHQDIEFGPGFWKFVHLAKHNFGWTSCPRALDLKSSFELTLFSSASVVCGRSESKIVFRIQPADAQKSPRILKMAREEARTTREHSTLSRLQTIAGVLQVSTIFKAAVRIGTDSEQWFGFTMPVCDVLTPDIATPSLFVHYATTMIAANEKGFCHNDLSLDNLAVLDGSGIIIDWEHATKVDTPCSVGKKVFAPRRALDAMPQPVNRCLFDDLESLFYVAVTCLLGARLEWPRIAEPTDLGRKRYQECCLDKLDSQGDFLNGVSCSREWKLYLEAIRLAMVRHERNFPDSNRDLKKAWTTTT